MSRHLRLGTILVPSSPIVQGLGTFPSSDNTTNALAPGATLLAKWSDGRNAIAIKGRVVATSASPDEQPPIPAFNRLSRNIGNFIHDYRVAVHKAGAGTGTVTSSPAGIACGAVCTGAFHFASKVTLTAVAGANSVFLGWGGACSGTALCQRTITGANVNVSAVFASTLACGNPQTGTAGADTLTGTALGDKLTGLAGNDVLLGVAGDDCLFGGPGKDRLNGGPGKDRLSGGSGNDRMTGGAGNDRLSGGSGRDRLRGNSGRDKLRGGSGKDNLNGGGSKDSYNAGSGNDKVNSADGIKEKVKCGKGVDRVKADKVDKLRSCELVKRV